MFLFKRLNLFPIIFFITKKNLENEPNTEVLPSTIHITRTYRQTQKQTRPEASVQKFWKLYLSFKSYRGSAFVKNLRANVPSFDFYSLCFIHSEQRTSLECMKVTDCYLAERPTFWRAECCAKSFWIFLSEANFNVCSISRCNIFGDFNPDSLKLAVVP